jgi:hypothetical protein
VLEGELLIDERELRELLSEEAELEAELSDALWELWELVETLWTLFETEVEIEQPARTRSTGISATRAEPQPSNRMRTLRRSALRRPVRCPAPR